MVRVRYSLKLDFVNKYVASITIYAISFLIQNNWYWNILFFNENYLQKNRIENIFLFIWETMTLVWASNFHWLKL